MTVQKRLKGKTGEIYFFVRKEDINIFILLLLFLNNAVYIL